MKKLVFFFFVVFTASSCSQQEWDEFWGDSAWNDLRTTSTPWTEPTPTPQIITPTDDGV